MSRRNLVRVTLTAVGLSLAALGASAVELAVLNAVHVPRRSLPDKTPKVPDRPDTPPGVSIPSGK